jgi:hypothetical protein
MDDPSRPARAPLPTATADDLYAVATYDFPIVIRGQVKVLKLRRLDTLTRFVEDILPMPLMAAASTVLDKIAAAGEGLDGPARDVKTGEAFATLSDEERADLREMLWRNAVAVAVAPKLSLAEMPGTFPVKLLSTETLLRIYNENPPDAPIAPLGGADATSFRGAVGDPAPPAGSDGSAVRAEAEQLADPALAG